jgi:hypothetical protein
MKTKTEKYKFKVSKDQYHNTVDSNFEDLNESTILNLFEEACLNLKQKNQPTYNMIELGSNQSYYSLLFKHILGVERTKTIMVEPVETNLNVGKNQFELNNCTGMFYHRGIGKNASLFLGENNLLSVTPITLEEIFLENKLNNVDILHCDIDGSEKILLPENQNLFKDLKFSYIFLMTHTNEIHSFCKQFLINCKYQLLSEHLIGAPNVGCDGLLVFSL